MYRGTLLERLLLLSILVAAAGFSAASDGPQAVSPGAIDQIAMIDTRCPTFSWQGLDETASYDLVVYELTGESALDLEQAREVVFTRVPGGATAWTPDLASCLVPGGSYAWFVRAVLDPGTAEATDWSAPQLFTVSSAPSLREVEQALSVLLRYVDQGSQPVSPEDQAVADLARSAAARLLPRSVQTGTAAIRGEHPDPSGETYGVVGLSASPQGAGIGAANSGGGPDLVLDGSTHGATDTELRESGIDRRSSFPETFMFENTGGGGMALEIDGVNVVTTATDQDALYALACASGEVTKWDGSKWVCAADEDTPPRQPGNQLTLAGNALSVVEGPGSGLNGDFLDGYHATHFAAAVHLHDDRYFTEHELETGGAGGAVHWDNVTAMPGGFADGTDDNTTYTAGPGLRLFGTQFSAAGVDTGPAANTKTSFASPGTVGLYTSITTAADGRGLISYYDETNGNLKVAHCHNLDCSSVTISEVDAGGDVGQYSSIAIGADDHALISYYDASNGNLKVAHCHDIGCTSATAYTLDSAGDVGTYTSVAIGVDGRGLISYTNETGGDLKVAHCDNAECTSASISTLDSADYVGFQTSLAIGADGRGLISYNDSENGDLKVAHCGDVACTTAAISILDSAGTVGRFTSVAIGTDGLGLISYYDLSNNDLKVAHCSGVPCMTATITTVDSADNVGFNSSVTIGADGLGLIIYYRPTGYDLKVAHCSDVECTAATRRFLDTTDSVGQYPSVTIGADGLPLMSYYDYTNGNLKVAHCSNQFCVPFFRRR